MAFEGPPRQATMYVVPHLGARINLTCVPGRVLSEMRIPVGEQAFLRPTVQLEQVGDVPIGVIVYDCTKMTREVLERWVAGLQKAGYTPLIFDAEEVHPYFDMKERLGHFQPVGEEHEVQIVQE